MPGSGDVDAGTDRQAGAGSGSVSPGQALAPGEQPASSGGSSPLVPVLIAIAVLAAISLGALAARRRSRRNGRSTGGSPVFPEAG